MTTESLVFATGYESQVPSFLDPVRDRIRFDDQGRYAATSTFSVSDTDDVFVQNGEEHTHGFVAPDLGMGALRNSVILASVLGREVHPVEKRIAFQEFAIRGDVVYLVQVWSCFIRECFAGRIDKSGGRARSRGKDPGFKQMVVIGHSQGGLLTKMTAIDSGTHLWPFTVPPEQPP